LPAIYCKYRLFVAIPDFYLKFIYLKQSVSQAVDAELKAFAAKTAPVVKRHLEMINTIQSQLK